MTATAQDFRVAMSRLAAGVVMVTCHVGGKPWGLTVSACCSVSMDPPLLLVSLAKGTASAMAIEETGRFGVSILADHNLEVARFGAATGQPKFVEPFCEPAAGHCESPVVAGALAHVDLSVRQQIAAGDHTIFIGDVELALAHDRDHPLVFCSRAFHGLRELH
jgi:flavin reductase (DIM6/NTAB) family NADH-FMN oxidoreductase RutF